MAILPLGQAGARKSLSLFYHFRKIGVNEEIIKKILRMGKMVREKNMGVPRRDLIGGCIKNPNEDTAICVEGSVFSGKVSRSF